MNNTNQSFLDKILSENEKDQSHSNFEVELLQNPTIEQEFILKIKDKTTGKVEEINMKGLDTSGAVSTPMDIEHLKAVAQKISPTTKEELNVLKIEALHVDAKNYISDQDNKNKGGTSFANAIGNLRKQYIEKDSSKEDKLKIK